MELVKISKVIPNENNPRFIKDNKFKKLVQSIKDFPEMLKLRPIVVNKDMVVLGGNMRLKACAEAGLKEVYILKADNLTEQQEREFIVKDNVGFGEWDWDVLANSWETLQLQDWGMDVWTGAQEEELFDMSENEDAEFTPKATDDNYSTFEIIMNHQDKVYILEVLNKLKIKLNLKTTADALLILAKNSQKND